jgi:hypothetical protein
MFHICLANFVDEMSTPFDTPYGPLSSVAAKSKDKTPSTKSYMDRIKHMTEIISDTKLYSLLVVDDMRREFVRLTEAMNMAMDLRLRRIYEPDQLPKDIVEKTSLIKIRDTKNKLPSYISLLGTDLSHISKAADKQQHVETLEKAIVAGQSYLKSPVGRIVTSQIDVNTLQEALQSSASIFNVLGTEEDLKLVELATTTLSLRRSVASTSWDEVRNIIYANAVIFDHPKLTEEIGRLLVEADNFDLCIQFEEALKKASGLHRGKAREAGAGQEEQEGVSTPPQVFAQQADRLDRLSLVVLS